MYIMVFCKAQKEFVRIGSFLVNGFIKMLDMKFTFWHIRYVGDEVYVLKSDRAINELFSPS